MVDSTSNAEVVQVSNMVSPECCGATAVSSPVTLDVQSELKQVKALLSEARNTREVLVQFEDAVKKGTYAGHSMLALAKGLAFLNAILAQNSAHISNLQERIEKAS